MKFHCIASPAIDTPLINLFQNACVSEGLEFTLHQSAEYDFTNLRQAADGDALYRITTSRWPSWPSRAVEQHLISQANLSTLYADTHQTYSFAFCSTALLQKKGISIPLTISHLTNRRTHLRHYVKYCGGFPVVLKVPGNSRGIGVIYADSYPTLFSTVDYLRHLDTNIIMQEYIPTSQSARLVVLGGEILASVEYESEDRDFRSNVGKNKKIRPVAFPEEIQRLAVNATAALNVEFAGVDILVGPNGKAYVIEVNFPCRFIRAQQFSATDIARSIVSHLVQKSLKLPEITPWHAARSR